MVIEMDSLSLVFSKALDAIEKEVVGISEYHSMRIAALSLAMGRYLNMKDDNLSALFFCALFHDNALNEYLLAERQNTDSGLSPALKSQGAKLRIHCEIGQKSISWLPFQTDISGFILYHHEKADGSGAFGKREGEYPLEAALIAAADNIDAAYHLQRTTPEELIAIRHYIKENPCIFGTGKVAEALLAVLDDNMLESLRDSQIYETIAKAVPPWRVDLSDPRVLRLADFISHIIDYKSEFTRSHTSQIANRSWIMSAYYGYSLDEKMKLYLAASLHDIGKMNIPLNILEKPDALNDVEFNEIKKHVQYTYEWLSAVNGFEEITAWASSHHEKLNGNGYPFGKKSNELDFNSRLLTCIDIYQAVSEERPYHPARNHADTIEIMNKMASSGLIDGQIVKDMDVSMAEFSLCKVSAPIIE